MFSRQEYWSGLPLPPPRDLSDPGIKPVSPALQADSLPLSHLGCPINHYISTDYTVHGILQARILEWVAFPFSGDHPNPGIEPRSPTLQVGLYQLSHKGSPSNINQILNILQVPYIGGINLA